MVEDACVHVGEPVPPDVNTYPVVPAVEIAIPEAVEYTIPPAAAVKLELVPPFASATIPVTLAAFPEIFPEIDPPDIVDEAESTPEDADTKPVNAVEIVPKDVSEDTAVFTRVPVVGSVTLVAPVEVRVIELAPLVASVEPLAIVNVPVLVEIARPLIDVAVATPSAGVVRVGDVARTTEPVPVTAETVVPLIFNTLPVPAVSNVLFVNVSVVALPTSVSVDVGRVIVPVFVIVEITGDVKVLFVNVCIESRSANV